MEMKQTDYISQAFLVPEECQKPFQQYTSDEKQHLSAAAYPDVGGVKLSDRLSLQNLLLLDQQGVPVSIHFQAKEPMRLNVSNRGPIA